MAELLFTNDAFRPECRSVPGVPMLLDGDMRLVEPACAWLMHIALVRGRTRSPQTWRAYGEALYDWWQTLEANGWAWDRVSYHEVAAYRDHMLAGPSAHTGRPYARATINFRLRAVALFYRWCAARGLVASAPFTTQEVSVARWRPAPFLSHVDASGGVRTANELVLREVATLPRPLAPDAIRRIVAPLGARDRLMVEWAAFTGMRRMEIAGLPKAALPETAAAAGWTPPAERPMAVLQIDHTLVDLILVDETWRKPVGRPWLSVAIDFHSRCIAGLHLSYEAPSATVAGLCLAHAALDKAAYLRGLGIKADWPCQGLPDEVFVDNGPEFHSAAFERGCQQHGIALRFRPPGAPHWGGIVERLVGTVMAMVHELPGTTFSNPGERGEYDSDAASCMTLGELERWLVLAVTGPCHHAVHGGVGEPPLARWRHGIAQHGMPRTVVEPHAFIVDFLPVLRRRITREGIVADHIAYFSDALRPLVAGRDRLGPVLVRRDPRDLSRVWVLDPEGGAYIEVPCSWQGRPRISLHEHRLAVAHLRERGQAQVNEDAIFRTVAQQREIVDRAAQRTRSARKRLARTADATRGAPARNAPVPAPVEEIAMTYDLEPYPAERW